MTDECRRIGLTRLHAPHVALAVFVGHAHCRWLGCLKAGFRHCFVALRDDRIWLACDPLKDRIELSVLPISADFDLAGFYVERGYTVLLGLTRPNLPRRPFGLAPLTCVTVVKRLLGVRAPWVLTPWQLCRHLRGGARGFLDVQSATGCAPGVWTNTGLDRQGN